MEHKVYDQEKEDSIVSLVQLLVSQSSQGGVDHCDPIIHNIEKWVTENKMSIQKLYEGEETVGLLAILKGGKSGDTICFNACLDTAPIGNSELWSVDPLSGSIKDSYIYGRGVADSKMAVSIFLHLMKDLYSKKEKISGDIHFLFDAEEHSGKFSGIKSYMKEYSNITKGFYIGYPGNDSICIGSRGFYRSKIIVKSKSGHSGSTHVIKPNSINIATKIINILDSFNPEIYTDELLGLPPKVSVTSIKTDIQESYSVIPSECSILVDIRLNTFFKEGDARTFLQNVINKTCYDETEITMSSEEGWPSYKISANEKILKALHNSIIKTKGSPVDFKVTGPSNIGNYLAKFNIPAICGFGVSYENIHGVDEKAYIPSIEQVYKVYYDLSLNLFKID